jgi:GAF domain-containing protein
MGRFKAKSRTGTGEAEAASWVGALSQVLDKFGLGERQAPELSELGPEIEVEVTDSVTGTQIRICTLDLAEADEDRDHAADPTTEAWDVPSLRRTPVFAQREDDGASALTAVIEESAQIASTVSVQVACELGLDILMAAIPAESASVLLRHGDRLRFTAVRGPRAKALLGEEMPHDEGIAGVVVRQGRGLVVREASRMEAHYREMDRQVEYHTRSILAVPMIDKGKVLGVVELLNPFGAVDFAEWHQRAAVRVGRQLAKRIVAD